MSECPESAPLPDLGPGGAGEPGVPPRRLFWSAVGLVVVAGLLLGFFWWGYWLGDYSLFEYQREYRWDAPRDLFLEVGPGRMLLELKLWLYLVAGVGFLVLCDWLPVSALRARSARTELSRELIADAVTFAPFLGLFYFLFVIASAREPTLASLFIFIAVLGWHLALQASALAATVATAAAASDIGGWAKRRSGRTAGAVVLLVALLTFAAFAWMNLRGYQSLRVGYKDSGMFATILYNTLHGKPFFADTVVVASRHYLGRHFSPGLLFLVPVFYLFPRHETLLVLHALFLTAAAVPIYLACRRLSRSALVGAALTCGYLVAAPLSHANWGNTYGFQPYSMVVLAVGWTLWAVVAGRRGWLAALVVLGLLLEEQYALVLVGLGGWLLVGGARPGGRGGRRLGAVLSAVGLVWFLCAVFWWMPWFGGGRVVSRYYGYLGATPGEVLWRLPGALARALADWHRWQYALHLLLPVGFLVLAAPGPLLVGAPLFLAIILADNPAKYSLILGHQGTLLPVVALSAALGAGRIMERPRLGRLLGLRAGGAAGSLPLKVGLAVLVSAASLGSGYFFAVSPLSRVFPKETFKVTYRDRLVKDIQALVPQEASLCATFRVASHFALRRHLYLYPLDFDPAGYPDNLGDPDYVLLDFAENWTHPGAVVPGRDVLWRDPGRRLLYAREGFLLYGRGENNRAEVLAGIRAEGARPRRPLNQDCGSGVLLVGTDSAIDPARPNLLRVTYYWRLTRPLRRQLFVTVEARQGRAPPRRFHHLLCNGKVPPEALPVDTLLKQTNTLELDGDVREEPVEVAVIEVAPIPSPNEEPAGRGLREGLGEPGSSPRRAGRSTRRAPAR